jgi:SAM-dependent methyltransferase
MTYDSAFYAGHAGGSERSARVILPIAFDLLAPSSVVDFGCGVGTWLSVARSLGATRVLGFDGDYVDRATLRIAPEEFRAADLESPVAVPGFDLAMSLEVAEHLAEAAAPRLVDALAGSADVVLFSAAIPGQKGRHHVNCQWQSWWARLFAERGFLAFDVFRTPSWRNAHVEPHYAQNAILYVHESRYRGSPLEQRIQPVVEAGALDVVHPALYTYYLAKYWKGLPGWWRRVRTRLRGG